MAYTVTIRNLQKSEVPKRHCARARVGVAHIHRIKYDTCLRTAIPNRVHVINELSRRKCHVTVIRQTLYQFTTNRNGFRSGNFSVFRLVYKVISPEISNYSGLSKPLSDFQCNAYLLSDFELFCVQWIICDNLQDTQHNSCCDNSGNYAITKLVITRGWYIYNPVMMVTWSVQHIVI